MSDYLGTPDGRYFVVKGRLWRMSNPRLSDHERERLVSELMSARRAVRDAKGKPDEMAAARQRVDKAKFELGDGDRFGGPTASQTRTASLSRIRPTPDGTRRKCEATDKNVDITAWIIGVGHPVQVARSVPLLDYIARPRPKLAFVTQP